MRRKAIENVLQIVIAFVLALIVCAMIGCTTTKYVETIKTDTLHHYELQYDSIVRIDSIYEKEYVKGDTIYKEKEVHRYRNTHKAKVDTVREIKVEYVEKPIEVEKKLSVWDKVKIGIADCILAFVALCGLAFAIFWVIKKK
jgi:lipocalin